MNMPAALGARRPLRVLLIEDNELFRLAFSLVAEEWPDIELVAQTALAAEGVTAARRHQPDVVLLDRRLPDGDAIDAIELLHQASPACEVLVLTGGADEEIVARAMKAGAAGLMVKGEQMDRLVTTIQRVAAGERVFPPNGAQGLSTDRPPGPGQSPSQMTEGRSGGNDADVSIAESECP
jgi:DNA-binding NarL/FixJ family response regulator